MTKDVDPAILRAAKLNFEQQEGRPWDISFQARGEGDVKPAATDDEKQKFIQQAKINQKNDLCRP